MSMDQPLPQELSKKQPEREQPGEAINEHQIRGKLAELRPDDRDYLCKAYNISPDALEVVVRTGISLLATDALSTAPTVLFQAEEVERALPPMGGALKLTVGEQPMSKLGLYLHKSKVEELLDRPLKSYDKIVMQDNTGSIDEVDAFTTDELEKVIKLNAQLQYQPHTEPLCSVALLNQGVIEAIIPIEAKALDIEYEDGEDFSAIYVRGVYQPNAFSIETMEALIDDARQAIEQAKYGLGLEDAGPKPCLILDANPKSSSGGRYIPPLGPHDGEGTLYITANRLLRWSDSPTPLEKQRVIRHEYMHAVDQWLGEEDEPFSSGQREIFAMLVNEMLSGIRGLPEPDQFDEQPLWFDKSLVGRVFTESFVLGDNLGHANENIHELVASLLNNVVDPHYYKKAFDGKIWQHNPLNEVQRAKYMTCHAKLMELVQERINEKLLTEPV